MIQFDDCAYFWDGLVNQPPTRQGNRLWLDAMTPTSTKKISFGSLFLEVDRLICIGTKITHRTNRSFSYIASEVEKFSKTCSFQKANCDWKGFHNGFAWMFLHPGCGFTQVSTTLIVVSIRLLCCFCFSCVFLSKVFFVFVKVLHPVFLHPPQQCLVFF